MPDTKPSAFNNDASPDSADIFPFIDIDGGGAGVHQNKGITYAQLRAALGAETTKVTTATQTNTTTTAAVLTELSGDTLTPGTYAFKAHVVWQSAATTTGISMWVRGNGGTVTRNVGHWYHVTTGGTAATGVADQTTTVATGQLVEGKAWRTNDTDPTPCAGVDTANADEMSVVEGIITVTADTTLQLVFRSEVAGSGVSIMAGSTLKYEKVA